MSASRSALFPGYTQVEAFTNEEDYERRDGEVDEEVTYVTLDLGTVEPTLVPSSSSYRLIGLDTPTPFLQLSGTMFKGQHQTLLGTELLFTDAKDDNNDRNKRSFIPIATTEHRIRFREVEFRPKSETTSNPPKPREPSKGSKKRTPKTLSEVVGGDDTATEDGKTKRRVRSRAKAKGKGKAVGSSEDAASHAAVRCDPIPVVDGNEDGTRGATDIAEGSSMKTAGVQSGVADQEQVSEAMDIDIDVESAQG